MKKQVYKNTINSKMLKKQPTIINTLQLKLRKETQVFFIKHFIFLKGPRGIILYSFFKEYAKYDLTLEKNLLTISRNLMNNKVGLVAFDKLKLSNLITNLIEGVHFFFSKKLLLVGIGLRAWIKTLKNNQKVLLIKVGFSEDLCIKIPKSFLVFSLRSNLLLIRGLNKEKINQFAGFVRLHKKPKPYKGIGIQYHEENFILKLGKKN
uniref:Ribosomal protein L6 n=1 Tax=Chroomonas placoidea TaxID=173977 RepID=A0A2P1G839_9CRYP|nr:ribosomal protein L6 [Chroomonas placoidea]AVM81109.1 ribosomal protein L6 [Chroomonas placoidea]